MRECLANTFFNLFIFLDDDDAEEEEEEDEPEDGYDQILKEQELAEQDSSHELYNHRKLFNEMEKEYDEKEVAEYYKQRYGKSKDSARFGSSDQLSDTIIQQRHLPGVKYEPLKEKKNDFWSFLDELLQKKMSILIVSLG